MTAGNATAMTAGNATVMAGSGASAAAARVLGLDPGLRQTGYAVLEAGPDGPRVRDAGVLRTLSRRGTDLPRRLRTLYEALLEVLDEWQPAAIAVEQLYAHYQHPRTAVLMAHARGVFLLAGAQRGIPVISYAATQVKRLITGSGRASKVQIQHAIARQLHLSQIPEPPDVADALAIALCHLTAVRLRG